MLAIRGSRARGSLLVLSVSELDQGSTDLNGDGDISDLVLHVHDAELGATVNLEVVASMSTDAVTDGRFVLASVSENEEGSDLNGDGDLQDVVYHAYDGESGAFENLRLAESGGTFGLPNLRPPTLEEGRAILVVDERAQGGRDLNGDGDALDRVAHALDLVRGTFENLGFAIHSHQQHPDGFALLNVVEAEQGARDLNGDGDLNDRVIHVVWPGTGVSTNLGLARGSTRFFFPYPVLGRSVWLRSNELAQGQDMNDDGDLGDDGIFGWRSPSPAGCERSERQRLFTTSRAKATTRAPSSSGVSPRAVAMDSGPGRPSYQARTISRRRVRVAAEVRKR